MEERSTGVHGDGGLRLVQWLDSGDEEGAKGNETRVWCSSLSLPASVGARRRTKGDTGIGQRVRARVVGGLGGSGPWLQMA